MVSIEHVLLRLGPEDELQEADERVDEVLGHVGDDDGDSDDEQYQEFFSEPCDDGDSDDEEYARRKKTRGA